MTLQRSELPSIPPAHLRQIEAWRESIRDHRTQIEALGLTVELIPSADAPAVTLRADDGPAERLPVLPAGKPRLVRATRGLSLTLPGWGQLRMRSGAAETRQLHEMLTGEETALRQALSEIGARDPAEAHALAARAGELDTRLTAARRTLAVILGEDESVETLRARLAADRRQWQSLEDELALTSAERGASLAEWEGSEQTATVQCEILRKERKSL